MSRVVWALKLSNICEIYPFDHKGKLNDVNEDWDLVVSFIPIIKGDSGLLNPDPDTKLSSTIVIVTIFKIFERIRLMIIINWI